jgi:hypothetical protein
MSQGILKNLFVTTDIEPGLIESIKNNLRPVKTHLIMNRCFFNFLQIMKRYQQKTKREEGLYKESDILIRTIVFVPQSNRF